MDCVSTLVSDIYQAFTDKCHLNALFLDIHSAFPSVSLPVLWYSLTKLGIPLHCSSFILSLMSPQTFIFSHSNYSPLTRTNYVGLPQGSSLSPILFNIYLLNILNMHSKATILSFADDLVIYNAHVPTGIHYNVTYNTNLAEHPTRTRSPTSPIVHTQM